MLVSLHTLYVDSYFQCAVVHIHLIIKVSVQYRELSQEWAGGVEGGTLEMTDDDVSINVL